MGGADLIGQPGVADRPLRRWPAPPLVEARLRYLEHADGHLDRKALGGHHRDRREPPLGSTRSPRPSSASFSNSTARRAICSSISNSAMRRPARPAPPSRHCSAPGPARVDAVLTPPHIDRLLTDLQVPGDVRDAATGLDEIKNPAAKLRPVTPSAHTGLPEWEHQTPATRPRTTRDTPSSRGWINVLAPCRTEPRDRGEVRGDGVLHH